MQKTVAISKEEYELLLKFRKIVESDFEEKFSASLVNKVRRSEKAYRQGKFIRVKTHKERRKLFESL